MDRQRHLVRSSRCAERFPTEWVLDNADQQDSAGQAPREGMSAGDEADACQGLAATAPGSAMNASPRFHPD
jgi:hypothetical protein